MGDVIQLSGRRRERPARMAVPRVRAAGGGAIFSFDLASPHTYLAAERVDRFFGHVRWVPVLAAEGAGADAPTGPGLVARATALRMPLVWPEPMPEAFPAAMRVAALASAEGRGAAFVLAAGRLAFCGGFDLNDPDTLAEAAGAAGLPLAACRAAARDRTLDEPMRAAGRRLQAQGADRLPVLQVERLLFCGEHRLAEALAAARAATFRRAQVGPGAPSAV